MPKQMALLFVFFILALEPISLGWTAASPDSVVAMLGDSLTAWGNWRHQFPDIKIRNFGVPGDTSGDILRRLDQVVEAQPSKIFIMAGANDLWNGSSAAVVAANMEKMISELKKACPRAGLYLQSMLPVNNHLLGPGIDHREVSDLNRRLKSMADKYEMTFIDLTDHMRDANGQLRQDFTRDGVHLTPAGYQVWQSVIRPFILDD